MILHMSLLRNLSMLKREVAVKFLFYKLGLAGTLVLYRITMEGRGSVDTEV